MAKHLNLTRVRDTYLILGLCLVASIFTRPLSGLESAPHKFFDMLGQVAIGLCVVSRIYCTAFIGDHKNRNLITDGPFAMCRNPLYFCSFVGVLGIAMMSNHLVLLLLIPLLFVLVYHSVIRREEAKLRQMFGAEYLRYCETTPRFWPRIGRFSTPASLTISARLLGNAVLDGVVWFFALPVFEFVEYAQTEGIINAFFLLY
ncbi:MAG: isoprenylcysteine carboxylmethyltransferase family protein [Gammaproteobacteria bacterium]|nr:isoprenylcysteine carboxylmethyltransferase family protein [Gammaproteobacteria bacterium]